MPPIMGNGDLKSLVKDFTSKHNVMIFSKSTCPFCLKVKDLFRSLDVEFFAVELDQVENGSEIQNTLLELTGQRTVPNVFIGGKHLGGNDDTQKAHAENRLLPMINSHAKSYDYDLIVIGGGSGGLAASKEAAKYDRKVAVFDFVKPTPIGTTWGLGGTCVNVGCIPKKLMHQAALLGHAISDAKEFGWELTDGTKHNWIKMKTAIQDHIGSLNWGYRVQLREQKVDYKNAYAEFIGPHRIKATDKNGKVMEYTADKFIIATGERPRYPDIPGVKEFGITSDDLFSLPYCPGKTLVVGASYVALECGGFLQAFGLDVTIMVRSILLRGFDQQMAELVGTYMENHGINLVRSCVPTKIERLEEGNPGKLRVTAQYTDGTEYVDEFNTVLFAIGRDACTENIGLERVGVQVSKNGFIPVNEAEQTNIPYIYAIGDILEGKPELTPVAIHAGKLLAQRLFGGSDTLYVSWRERLIEGKKVKDYVMLRDGMKPLNSIGFGTAVCETVLQTDYVNVATTVFTPLEYGCIGLSEEDAIQKYGESNVEVYHANFTPLEWTVPHREENGCYGKLVCVISENEKVVGFHVLGPNAGEITQGYAVAMKLGATKADFNNTIGIHPTCTEVFTTMVTSKRSGQAVDQAGC